MVIQQNLKFGFNKRVHVCRVSTSSWKKFTNSENSHYNASYMKPALIIGVAGGLGLSLLLYENKNKVYAASVSNPPSDSTDDTDKYGQRIDGLPEYTLEKIAEHCSMDKEVWVSYRHGVYNITKFINYHPGGDKIMLGAGGDLGPFWQLYGIHKSPHILEMLEKYRIGNLAPDDVGYSLQNTTDPYANEPKRHIAIKPSSKKPFNGEPPLGLLVDSVITPNDLFYIRNHLPVPDVDPATYELEVEGLGVEKSLNLSLDELKKFPKHSVVVAVQCGGNRRSEMAKVKPVKGLSWGQAAISNARWSGAKLSEVLASAGVTPNDKEAKHVQFEGLDLDATSHPYGGSIPFSRAMDPKFDVLLAYEMNGEPLPRDHGYPVRVIIPGVVGARHVKWLYRVVISDEESQSHHQQRDYKGFAPNVDWGNVDWSKSPAIQDLPVTSAICQPEEGQTLKVKNGKVLVKGYAFSGGGREIVRVDVSTDDGKTWQAADVLTPSDNEPTRAWGWTLWSTELPVKDGQTEVKLCSKAVDSGYNVQPENFDSIWNLRGVLANAYHRVRAKVEQ